MLNPQHQHSFLQQQYRSQPYRQYQNPPANPPEYDLSQLKRKIQEQNYKFNQHLIQSKEQKLRSLKQKQKYQYSLINQKTLRKLQEQRERQLRKKEHVRQLLRKEYDQQIYKQSRLKTQQKSINKYFAENQKLMLENYQKKRINDIGKMYNVKNNNHEQTDRLKYLNMGKKSNSRNVLTQPCQDSLDQLKFKNSMPNAYNYENQEYEKRRNSQMQPIRQDQQRIQRKNISSLIKNSQTNENTPINSTTKKYSDMNLQYSEYLKKQIQRKQIVKQMKKREQLQRDKQMVEKQYNAHLTMILHKKMQNQQKKYEFSTGLYNQIKLKQKINDPFGSKSYLKY